jgi:hypothetical protein
MVGWREFVVMKKYRKGAILDEVDRDIIERYQSMGLARTGFTEVDGRPVSTARLTPEGMNRYIRIRDCRNPVKRFLYSFANI